MAVRIADSLKQQNDLTSFPVAYGSDLWLDKNKGVGTEDYDTIQNLFNSGELGGGGSVQVETMPAASAENVGKIVQYVGETGSYKKGHFYECVHNKCDVLQPVYRWIDVSSYRYNHVVYNQTTEPINSDFIAGDIIYYTGVLTEKFKPNHYYRALPSIGTMEKYTFTMYKSTYGGMVFWSYTPFEFRQGFIVYPTGGGGEWEPYEITSITDEKVTITPYGDWGGEPLEFDGVLYTSEVKDWEELDGGGGTSIFHGTMDEWNALTADEKKQYDYMADDDEDGSDLTNFVTDIADTEANKLLNAQNTAIDCNTTLKVGVYACSMQTTNRPSGVDYGVLMVFGQKTEQASSSAQWIYQFFYETAGRVYRRYAVNPNTLTPSASQWTTWELITGLLSGTATVNTTNASGTITWVRTGRLVIVNLSDVSLKVSTSNSEIASNLPKAIGRYNSTICSDVGYCDIHINLNGTTLYSGFGASLLNNSMNGQITYLTED